MGAGHADISGGRRDTAGGMTVLVGEMRVAGAMEVSVRGKTVMVGMMAGGTITVPAGTVIAVLTGGSLGSSGMVPTTGP